MLKTLLIAGASALSLAALSACTQAEADYSFSNYGKPARITCFSGGYITVDDFSTGKVSKHGESDGFYYTSQTSGRTQELTGDCSVDYGAPKPEGWTPTHRRPVIAASVAR
ncbi:hypothetical protein CcrC1_gp063c [Caulobacter phage C1]|nr:hypothetical protein CcrC1_gp063c [Caulobacter phage C1]UTU08290.1 hypothetical protein CcrC2_gp062c [Caulobacter phage C2]UTU08813.1 hypothetical protein CcrJ4_gp062c [Caulobacter phage J4]UTU09925.1 hypothetical protein CcrRB23_gp063c [Caulobacter phage RB23]WGN96950.1 hypothetical protein [Bertelyvirus sp.]